ncbi:MAG: hypothetical protein M1821_003613 [Bathelium mastoideum]|nr:MAG: hypothetical protein M1821_003613 [Bathelium mastoideum]
MRPPDLEIIDTSMTSVAVLPSPIYTSPARLPSKRPKLTLNTGHHRIYAKGPTSLRLEALSAVSPTFRNTFSNTFAGPDSPGNSGGCKSLERVPRPPTPLRTEQTPSDAPNYSATPTSCSTSSSAESSSLRVPYEQPRHLTSILSNSPIPRIDTHKMSFSTTRPLFPSAKRVSFRNPLAEEIKTEKYVLAHSDLESTSSSTISSLSLSLDVLPGGQMPGFITPSPSGVESGSKIEDKPASRAGRSFTHDASQSSLQPWCFGSDSVKTKRPPSLSSSRSSSPEFTFSLPSPREDKKHDSLEPLVSSTSSTKLSPFLSTLTARGSSPSPAPLSPRHSPTLSGLSTSPRVGEKRDSSSSEDEGEEEDDVRDTRDKYPCTPVAGRRKRRREWMWTLDPLPGMQLEESDNRVCTSNSPSGGETG